MRRLLAVCLSFVLLPSTAALAADLDELLDESRSASYTAEQLISCFTPDGERDALIELQQREGEIRYGGKSASSPEVWSGFGGWVVESDGSVIESANIPDVEETLAAAEPNYLVEETDDTLYLGRRATTYVLKDGDLTRAELIVDRATGVLLSVITFDTDGNVYCERKFTSFKPGEPLWPALDSAETQQLVVTDESTLPESLAGFTRLDVYVDESGLNFGYYSDGFFSFAVFESSVGIILTGGVRHEVGQLVYQREFTPGQVTYTWPIERGGMALIGDLPPDMHDAVLAELPPPYDPGFLKRLWRSLFG